MSRIIPLFYPTIPTVVKDAVYETLGTRWLGQGPKVDRFETRFQKKFNSYSPVAVGSGTDALHLAYILAGIGRGDEVIAPVFTCTATNLPLLYQGAKIKFADVDPDSLNISVDHVKKLLTKKTKAIVIVDYGGLPCDLAQLQQLADAYKIPLIEDAAHSLGARYMGQPIGGLSDYTIFSFQAIKLLTTGDGGMLTVRNAGLAKKAKRLRWFGIDREAKSLNNWDNQITEVGYKYQMNDIAASMGLTGLGLIGKYLAHRRQLFERYKKLLKGIDGISILNDDEEGKTHAHWLFTVKVERRKDFEAKLHEAGIECSQTHYRNDLYKVFGGRQKNLFNMDALEDKYEILPMHGQMTLADVAYICKVIRGGW